MENHNLELINVCISSLGGYCAHLVGGYDALFSTFLIIMCCDWLIGVLKALKNHKFSRMKSVWGIVNKLVSIILVIVFSSIQSMMSLNIPVRETLISMMIINETLSLLRNSSVFVKGLEPFTDYFEDMKIKVVKVFKVGD